MSGRLVAGTARAPGRVDLAGGTLDIWPLGVFHRGASTVNVAIAQYATCFVCATQGDGRRAAGGTIRIVSPRRVERYSSYRGLELAGARLSLPGHVVRLMKPATPLCLTVASEIPVGSGLGGSSALAIAVVAAVSRHGGMTLSRAQAIRLALEAEVAASRVPDGTQDHYAAAFGGVSQVHYGFGPERRESLRVDTEQLEQYMLLCHTRQSRSSAKNNWRIFRADVEGRARVRQGLDKIAAIAHRVASALERQAYWELGKLVSEEWDVRSRLCAGMSTAAIADILRVARHNGAIGGKACGAGGGGHVLLVVDPHARLRVTTALVAAGYSASPVRIDTHGVRWRRSRPID